MDKQQIINAIGTLSGTIDSLNRVGDTKAIEKVTAKLLELIDKL